MKEVTLEILPSGHIRIGRGDADYNTKVRKVLSKMFDDDKKTMADVDEFLSGSEGSELLIGDKIFCG